MCKIKQDGNGVVFRKRLRHCRTVIVHRMHGMVARGPGMGWLDPPPPNSVKPIKSPSLSFGPALHGRITHLGGGANSFPRQSGEPGNGGGLGWQAPALRASICSSSAAYTCDSGTVAGPEPEGAGESHHGANWLTRVSGQRQPHVHQGSTRRPGWGGATSHPPWHP